LALVAAENGDESAAVTWINEAVALMSEGDFLEQRASALVVAFHVFHRFGRPDEAKAALDEAEQLYAAKDIPVVVERLRALRAELDA
jgi:hypothetical protein